MSTAPSPNQLLVACLCAQWCGTCRDYQSVFEQLEAEFPEVRFVWIDIEDEADLVDPLEVDNFPTLLMARQGQARFFGTLTPHTETLRRLIQSQLAEDAVGRIDGDALQGVVDRLQRISQGGERPDADTQDGAAPRQLND